MKKLHKLVLSSYIGTFAITFLIATFVFLMIFVFAYIDEFVGKHLSFLKLLELFFYFSLNTIPRSLPLAFLLSSIMSIGNMTEHYEIAAMKTAGISFFKITQPLFIFTLIAGIFLFLFSNFFLPANNLRLQTLLMSIRTTKPSLMFKEGVFNNELKGYSMRFGKIDEDGKSLGDILMYDHTGSNGNTTVLSANSGKISELNTQGIMLFTLYDGSSYKELTDSNGVLQNNDFIRERFNERTFRFDLSGFLMNKVNQDNFKDDYEVLNLWQIEEFIDSLEKENLQIEKMLDLQRHLKNKETDTINRLDYDQQRFKNRSEYLSDKLDTNKNIILKYTIEWHKKAISGFACLVLFLIGSSLGYIIKKGGLGMPLVVSTLLYIMYHTLSIIGEKIAEDGEVKPYQGVWFSTAILLPVGLFLFYRASKDRIAFEGDFFYKIKEKFRK